MALLLIWARSHCLKSGRSDRGAQANMQIWKINYLYYRNLEGLSSYFVWFLSKMNWLRSELAFRTLDQLWQWFMQTLHCKQYSVRGSVIKTYNEPLTDYLQSISAEVFSLGKHDTGPCLESSAWVWRMRRGSEETRAWYALEITPGYDTKKLRRWITWREIIIMLRTDKHSTVLFPGQDYSLDPLFCWHRGWH